MIQFILTAIGFIWVACRIIKYFIKKSNNKTNTFEKLEQLKRLKDKNILTEEEYNIEKRKILNGKI